MRKLARIPPFYDEVTYKSHHRLDNRQDLLLRVVAEEDIIINLGSDGVVPELKKLNVSMLNREPLPLISTGIVKPPP